MDAVPTTVAVGPDGALYVGELTGFPYPVGGARIYRVVPGEVVLGETPPIYADGFTNVIDIAFDHDGSLLVLELAKNCCCPVTKQARYSACIQMAPRRL
jgi:hypothetical protein